MAEGFFKPSTLTKVRPAPSLLARCGACKLYETCNSPKMALTGGGKKSVLIVGESPGYEEDEVNAQFVGDAGQYLRRALRKIQVDLDDDCWKTNSLICRPFDESGRNSQPTSAEIEYCRPNLLREIDRLDPKIIILLGVSSVTSLIGHLWKQDPGTINRWAGWRIPDRKLNAWVCPTWDPLALMKLEKANDQSYIGFKLLFDQHLDAAFDLSERPWPDGAPDFAGRVKLIQDSDEAAAIIEKLADHPEGLHAAFDYETDRLKPYGAGSRILCASIAWGTGPDFDDCIAFPWTNTVVGSMKRFLSSKIRKIASNLQFEEKWSRAILKQPVRNWWWDTMLGGHLGDNRAEVSGLKFQSYAKLGYGSYDDHIAKFLKSKGSSEANTAIRDIEMSDLLKYCGEDSILEYTLAWQQRLEMLL